LKPCIPMASYKQFTPSEYHDTAKTLLGCAYFAASCRYYSHHKRSDPSLLTAFAKYAAVYW
jgi:hypothetical protein